MKRLFCVRSKAGKLMPIVRSEFGSGKETSRIEHFDNKQDAKAWRDCLNEDNDGKTKDYGYHVSRGLDHIGKHGCGIARMRLQPKRRTTS